VKTHKQVKGEQLRYVYNLTALQQGLIIVDCATRPETKEELFNLRHAMMRNVVERTFGTWKKRFPILVHPLPYGLKTQRDLVLALAVLHNMIIDHTSDPEAFVIDPDELLMTSGEDDLPPEDDNEPTLTQVRERARNNTWRDRIAQNMWDQYQAYLCSKGAM
jgi:transposase-like protein